jgi:predicted nucleotidyltransferase
VLYFLASNPLSQFHEREVVRQTGVSVGAVNKILRDLYEHGFVEKEKRGKMHLYRINIKDPVVRQFKVLFNVLSINRLIKDIRRSCKRIVLFGSCSEGTDVKESDIDIFILTLNSVEVRKKINEYEKQLKKRISPIIVNSNELVRMKQKDKPLYERISRGIVLWEQE